VGAANVGKEIEGDVKLEYGRDWGAGNGLI
jgi:hypothetical protein